MGSALLRAKFGVFLLLGFSLNGWCHQPPKTVVPSPSVRPLLPSDDSSLDPSFLTYRRNLLEVIRKKDWNRFMSEFATQGSVLDQEGIELAHNWVWEHLTDTLRMGVTRVSENLFVGPYYVEKYPVEYRLDFDETSHWIVVGRNVTVHSRASGTSQVIGKLSAGYVEKVWHKSIPNEPREAIQSVSDKQGRHWRAVRMPSGKIGFVSSQFARDVDEWSVRFEKQDNVWKITFCGRTGE